MQTTSSPLDFRVKKSELMTVDGVPVKDKCALVREDTNEAISIVGKKFGIIQNDMLFPELDSIVFDAIDGARDSAKIIDRTAHNGRVCYRDYIFPSEVVNGDGMWKSDSVTDLGFMLTLVNGFGGTSLQLYGGAIDFYCSNGIVHSGKDVAYRRRHSRRVEVFAMDDAIKKSVDTFKERKQVWREYAKKELTNDQVIDFLDDNIDSVSLGKKLFRQWVNEREVRGSNAWALISAFTHYSSHTSDGMFAVRNTGNDTEASTRMSRSLRVSRIIESPEFLELVA